MLQDLHKKLETQKEAKKSSTAIEELIFQVKEVRRAFAVEVNSAVTLN